MIDPALVAAVRDGLAEVADPAKAPGMQAYMKSDMPYHGVPAPQQRQVFRAVFAAHPLASRGDWTDTTLELWRAAAYREERYAAIALTGHRLYRAHQTPAALPLYEEMVVDGAWWDHVDAVAIGRIGPLVAAYPDALKPVMLRWSTDPDRWRRRTAIICQVGVRGTADLDLLYAVVEPNLADTDFFVRKGIGWALRQYAWADPDEVERYVTEHGPRMSGLSRREALKNITESRARAGGNEGSG
ncbi:MAG: DNA alkylation repair protein [Geodermatophilaceae bacterium]|nr:DNA alkylation repair protein [Geodermatophilaceae bacterium]